MRCCLWLLGCLVFSLWGCNSKEVKDEPPEEKTAEAFFAKDSTQQILSSYRYYIDSSKLGWVLKFKGVFEDFHSASARFVKTDNDTLKSVTFELGKNDLPVGILQYIKEYKVNGKEFYVKLDRSDTVYCYYRTATNPNVFVVGEYNFKAENLQFDVGQHKYYKLYRDSLSKVRGNHLAELPTISLKDMARYFLKFGKDD